MEISQFVSELFEVDTEQDLEDQLMEFFNEVIWAMPGPMAADMHLGTFRDKGVLTDNKGIVLGIGKNEFQITIAQSRR